MGHFKRQIRARVSASQKCLETVSEQLPCRSAEVNFFAVFLCQRCREIWREILVNFSCYVFQGLGVRWKISPKFHVKNGVKNGKFHANFTLLGRSAETVGRQLLPRDIKASRRVLWVPLLWMPLLVLLDFPKGWFLGKEKNNKHKEFWRDTRWCASRLSRGHVPSVP